MPKLEAAGIDLEAPAKPIWAYTRDGYIKSRLNEYQEGEESRLMREHFIHGVGGSGGGRVGFGDKEHRRYEAFKERLGAEWDKQQYNGMPTWDMLRAHAKSKGYKGGLRPGDTNRIAMLTFLDHLNNPRPVAEVEADLAKAQRTVDDLKESLRTKRTLKGQKADAAYLAAVREVLAKKLNQVAELQTELAAHPAQSQLAT